MAGVRRHDAVCSLVFKMFSDFFVQLTPSLLFPSLAEFRRLSLFCADEELLVAPVITPHTSTLVHLSMNRNALSSVPADIQDLLDIILPYLHCLRFLSIDLNSHISVRDQTIRKDQTSVLSICRFDGVNWRTVCCHSRSCRSLLESIGHIAGASIFAGALRDTYACSSSFAAAQWQIRFWTQWLYTTFVSELWRTCVWTMWVRRAHHQWMWRVRSRMIRASQHRATLSSRLLCRVRQSVGSVITELRPAQEPAVSDSTLQKCRCTQLSNC